ncbi:uncharacterized protein L203_105728 [Cryptococcus depauperatus CBS 7841]|uniref:Uncharacterized protein n=1 Tax=Cryptococcus depauperatus CBS 7841 TaxID=1295531 RepID=A0AAJ8JY37_9TREE
MPRTAWLKTVVDDAFKQFLESLGRLIKARDDTRFKDASQLYFLLFRLQTTDRLSFLTTTTSKNTDRSISSRVSDASSELERRARRITKPSSTQPGGIHTRRKSTASSTSGSPVFQRLMKSIMEENERQFKPGNK